MFLAHTPWPSCRLVFDCISCFPLAAMAASPQCIVCQEPLGDDHEANDSAWCAMTQSSSGNPLITSAACRYASCCFSGLCGSYLSCYSPCSLTQLRNSIVYSCACIAGKRASVPAKRASVPAKQASGTAAPVRALLQVRLDLEKLECRLISLNANPIAEYTIHT